MTGTAPRPVEGSQGPSALELLWEKNRSKASGLLWILVLAMGGYYGYKYYNQSQVNSRWSKFAAETLLQPTYAPADADAATLANPLVKLQEDLVDLKPAEIDSRIAAAGDAERPYLLWVAANSAARNGDKARVNAYLQELKSRYPDHALCVETPFPVQVRDPEKESDADKAARLQGKTIEPKFKPAVKGRILDALQTSASDSTTFAPPASWAKPEIPADAPKYKISFAEPYGSFTIALMTQQAPK